MLLHLLVARFQSTLPREERRRCTVRLFLLCISIHAPTRGATCFHFVKLLWGLFQSTLPREERQISHTCVSFEHDFNPRSHERSDLYRILYRFFCQNFNPRSHERSDLNHQVIFHSSTISIHAPTRGATEKQLKAEI